MENNEYTETKINDRVWRIRFFGVDRQTGIVGKAEKLPDTAVLSRSDSFAKPLGYERND